MAINFDALPKDKPEGLGFAIPAEGFHLCTITKPTIKVSGAGNEYLEILLKTADGKSFFDRIMTSDAPALQYKLSRFITACKLPLVGEITFKDLGKVVEGKQIVADVKHVENEWKDKVTTKAEVDIFSNDIFYAPEEYNSLMGGAPTPQPEIDSTPGTY